MSEIRKYVRNRKGHPVGLLIADKVDGKVKFGWSKCNNKDRWNPSLAYTIARGRLEAGSNFDDIASTMIEPAMFFTKRAVKYFND